MASGINKGFQTSYLQPGGGQSRSNLDSGINTKATRAAQERKDNYLGLPQPLDAYRAAAGLTPQGNIGTPTVDSLVSSARVTNPNAPTPPVVGDVMDFFGGIYNRHQKTANQMQANRLKNEMDLGRFGGFGGDVTGLEPFGGSGQFIEGPTPESMEDYDDDLGFATQGAINNLGAELQQSSEQSGDSANDDPLEPFGGAGRASEGAFDPYGGMIEDQMRAIEALKGNDPDAKKTEDYMKEFAEATGVSIDGKADKSQALMAFGLALMQNKAGKGFDVSKALSALGEAGTAAAPAFQKAKDTARANRIAAGKYGLQQVAKDATARASSLSAAQGRLSELMQTNIDAQTKRELKGMEHNNAIQLKILEHQAASAKAASEGKYDFKNVKQIDDKGLPGLKTTVGIRETDGQSIFVYPEDEIGVFGGALADVNEGTNALAEMRYLISSNMSKPGGTSLQRAKGFLEGATRSFGFNMDQEPIFEKRKNDDGETVEVFVGYNDKAVLAGDLQKADAIRDRVIAQFKRFLTQETGNGISNVDIKNVENLLGKIDFGGDPSIALARIDEAMNIFTSKREKLNSRLEIYTDQSRYRNEKSYQDSMGILRSSAASAYGLDTSGFTGVQMVKDDETGLDVIKLS